MLVASSNPKARCGWAFISCGDWATRSGTRLEAALAEGPFEDVLDFARRTRLERETLENLAIAGAFAPWFASRREAMWALRGLDEREARGEFGRAMDVDEPPLRLRLPTAKKRAAFDL